MSINLNKGYSINLKKRDNSKTENNLSKITIGLGWDIANGRDYDLDACALLLTDDVLKSPNDIVSYSNLKHKSGQVWSTGDNLTGDGEGDDEQIIVKLDSIPKKYNKIVFYTTIYSGRSRGQNFSGVKNAFIRAVDANGYEMLKFDMSGSKQLSDKCSYIFGEIIRTNDGWEFKAIGDAYETDSLKNIADMYKNKINNKTIVVNTNTATIPEEPKRKKLFGLF